MDKLIILILTCSAFITQSYCILPYRPSPIREFVSLDGLWNFYPNNITTLPQYNILNTDLNVIPVPSSYNDIGTQKGLRDYAGAVTYNRTFFVPKSWKSKRIWIRFGSVCYSANVTVNNANVIEHSIGHLPFGTEVTSLLNFGDENEITVVVDNTLSETTIPQGGTEYLENGMLARTYTFDFFDYSGIDRPVVLYTTNQVYIDDITLNTAISITNNSYSGIVNYSISILGTDHCSRIRITIIDQNRNIIFTKSDISNEDTIVIENAHLWWPYLMNPESGYLYTFRVELTGSNSKVIDRYDQPFGIRELFWDNESFTINGKPIYFKGMGRHEDSDFRGKGTDFPLFIKDNNLLRWLGANSYRTSHYPYCEELMDLADQLGIMIIDEVPSVNTEDFGLELLENHKRSFTELYNRDKNRPSVVAWSCANEPKSQYIQSSIYFAAVVLHIKSLDTTRPVTAAIAQYYDVDNIGEFLDIIGFNRYQAWYENTADLDGITNRIVSEVEGWYNKYNKPVLCTEYGADTLEGLHILPTYIWSEEYQKTLMSNYFKAFDILKNNYPWFIGEHIWNFADFKTAESYVRVGYNKKGIFTRNRQPKSSAFLLRKRYWSLAASDGFALPNDLEDYVTQNYVIHSEL